MINAKDADAVSEPAVLMRYTIQMTVQMSFSTVKWQNMHRQSVTTVRISILHWYRISARTVTVTVRMMHRSFRISVCLPLLIRWHWIRRVQMSVLAQHRCRTASLQIVWKKRISAIIMIILRIQHRIQSTRLVWHTQRRSVLGQESMN